MSHRYFESTPHAQAYAQFRPCMPQSLADKIVWFLKQDYSGPLKMAIDVGCGSGQSTMALATHFDYVLGVDVSPSQIEEAKNRVKPPDVKGKVEFRVSPAEKLPIEDNSVQLVSAGVAFHFFDGAQFMKEVQRVLQPNGVVAAYVYNFPRPLHPKGDQVQEMIKQFFFKYAFSAIGTYPLIKDKYDAFTPFPGMIKDESCFAELKGTGLTLRGLMRSWSSVEAYYQQHGEEEGNHLIGTFCQSVLDEMGAKSSLEETPMELVFQYDLRLGRKPT